MIPQVFLNAKQAKHFDGRHPWVLERSVVSPTMELEPGQVVEFMHPNGSWIGRGIYNPNSRIRIRLYQWEQTDTLDSDWLCRQLARAIELREAKAAAHGNSDAVRLVNSEGDGLSGLIVDRFGQYLVIQLTSLAMFQWKTEIIDWFQSNFEFQGIQVSLDGKVAKQEGVEPVVEWVSGTAPTEKIGLTENGVQLQIDLESGQKTGYYLDQRANRRVGAEWMQPGRLLDVCCYHGGFSLAGFQSGKLTEIVAVDSSERALEQARSNAAANNVEAIHFEKADCFSYLKRAEEEKATFDNVVLDPPRMAGSRQQIQSALRAYHRLNLSAINLLRPGGTLITCSCSGRVYREDFWGVLASAAKRTRRRVQVVESRGADFDHPVDVNCPETDYLKCFICRVY
ncbi:MAG: class I SAM-dependent rRNA methyltransferase [Pirellulaceae bacterium]